MSLKWITRFICILNFSVGLNSAAQNNRVFLDYLYKHELELEISRYIEKNFSGDDSLKNEWIRYSLFFRKDSLLLAVLSRPGKIDESDSALCAKIGLVVLKHGNGSQKQGWFQSQASQCAQSASSREINELWLSTETPVKYGGSLHANEYSDSYKRYKKMYMKKPGVAAALSALVPGLGKLYIGKPRSFAGVLLANTIIGAQTYESVTRLGPKNALSILNIATASLYYLSNIAGSYHDCRVSKKMKKLIYLNEASSFYNDYFNFSSR